MGRHGGGSGAGGGGRGGGGRGGGGSDGGGGQYGVSRRSEYRGTPSNFGSYHPLAFCTSLGVVADK